MRKMLYRVLASVTGGTAEQHNFISSIPFLATRSSESAAFSRIPQIGKPDVRGRNAKHAPLVSLLPSASFRTQSHQPALGLCTGHKQTHRDFLTQRHKVISIFQLNEESRYEAMASCCKLLKQSGAGACGGKGRCSLEQSSPVRISSDEQIFAQKSPKIILMDEWDGAACPRWCQLLGSSSMWNIEEHNLHHSLLKY